MNSITMPSPDGYRWVMKDGELGLSQIEKPGQSTHSPEWDEVFEAILEETGNKDLAAATATSRIGKASKEYLEEALRIAREQLPDWAYDKIHRAARSRAGGKRRGTRMVGRVMADMAMAQMTKAAILDLSDKELCECWDHLSRWFTQYRSDEGAAERIVATTLRVSNEMMNRNLKIPASKLTRRVNALREIEKTQIAKNAESAVPILNKHRSIAFVVSEPNETDKLRGSYLTGLDGRTFLDSYLKPLGLNKSDVCIMDITQLDWLKVSAPVEVIALGRFAKNALGDSATLYLPHPQAIRRRGDSGEVGRKLTALRKRSILFSVDSPHPTKRYCSTSDRGTQIENAQSTELIEKLTSQIETPLKADTAELRRDCPGELEHFDVPILKADEEKQIVYGIVLDPYQVDSQNDWVSPKEIEDTAHDWMASSRTIGVDHTKKASGCYPVESSLVPYPSKEDYTAAVAGKPHRAYTMPFGDDVVHSGSWVLGTKLDDANWKLVQEGHLNAYSIGGYGTRKPMAQSEMPEVTFLKVEGQ